MPEQTTKKDVFDAGMKVMSVVKDLIDNIDVQTKELGKIVEEMENDHGYGEAVGGEWPENAGDAVFYSALVHHLKYLGEMRVKMKTAYREHFEELKCYAPPEPISADELTDADRAWIDEVVGKAVDEGKV